ncbi:AAA family ATPase [Oceanomicrobium pacificus]|uniref:AAA family ATPase n=1 Tax=Oceanomicrobium pacificus TaxID=2692916 RepID=A0A6B0TNK0_9RHOB|nr:ATP-binding protein [Oceanomicrobium pacificus]MXU64159.1 AAA family ATPase [Oceanomicrobium pacificus]
MSPAPDSDADRALVHLICGATGAGKSTYARQLATDIGGVRFSIDEWLAELFLPDGALDSGFDWFYERVQRACSRMRSVAEQLGPIGVPSIFDVGLTDRKERGIFEDWAAEQGFPVRLHWIDVDPETRWARVQQRNANRSATFSFEVDRGMFDFIESIWEAPDAEEMARMNGLRITD